jgi:hypothetical protein
MSRLKALTLLSECTGDDIWSIEHCRMRGLPEDWIQELSDCYESGFKQLSQTIFVGDEPVNQYHGLKDVDIAIKLGEHLGIDVEALRITASSRVRLVTAIQEAIEEA